MQHHNRSQYKLLGTGLGRWIQTALQGACRLKRLILQNKQRNQ